MNKLFVAVFVLAIGASYGFLIDLLDKLPGVCKVDQDCGKHRCCLNTGLLRVCTPKLGRNMPCEMFPGDLFKCGCREGLECKVTLIPKLTILGKPIMAEIKQCRTAGEPVEPEVIDEEQPQKRFLGGLPSVVDKYASKFARKCSGESDCGESRCCADIGVFGILGKRCFPTIYKYFPCISKMSHCCDPGLVCRNGIGLSVDVTDNKRDFAGGVKMCLDPLP